VPEHENPLVIELAALVDLEAEPSQTLRKSRTHSRFAPTPFTLPGSGPIGEHALDLGVRQLDHRADEVAAFPRRVERPSEVEVR